MRYAITRILLAIPVVLVLLTLMFLVLRVMPGDPVLAMLGGRNVSPELIEEYRHRLGLDRPIPVQYLEYLGGLIRGDLGTSLRTNRPVLRELLDRFPATLELSIAGMLVAVVLGLLGGVFGATRAGRVPDHLVRVLNIGFFAMPIFWLGLMLQVVFAVQLRWMPVGGRLDPISAAFFEPITGFYLIDTLLKGDWELFVSALRHLLLPAFTLGLVLSGVIGRMSRTQMLEVLDADYVRTARAKGLPERRVVFRHALRNALVPVVTVIGLQFALLLAGAILTETVYSWPGIARFLLVSIDARDFPAIQGTVVFIALFVSTVSLVVDLLYPLIDPRVRY